MQILYTGEKLDKMTSSIFLAGPTPRSNEVSSWRPDAIKLFKEADFQGTILSPEWRNGVYPDDYIAQVEWEYKGLENCNVIMFWIPRKLETMPAFTTNVEFGRYCNSLRTVYGRPENSEKNSYLDWLYTKVNDGNIYCTLKSTVEACIKKIHDMERVHGHPMDII